MANASGTYEGEELEVSFTASASDDWMGDPSVPNGTVDLVSFNDIKLDKVTILGIEVELATLPESLQAALIALGDEVDFTVDEEDPVDLSDDD
jgi:hypothetical protein